jgi:hypothetical protein
VEAKRNNPSVITLVLIMVVIVAVIFYLVVFVNTGDAQWFVSTFDGTPNSIVVHCFGTDKELTPVDAHFEPLNALLNQAISSEKRWDPLSLSDATYLDYQTHPDMMTLEMTYAPPVRVHSNTKYFSNVDTLIIPLVGRHAQYNTVFGRYNDEINAGSFHLESTAQMTEYLAAQGICKEP